MKVIASIVNSWFLLVCCRKHIQFS